MRIYGLIGKTLSHSFSGKYFGEKFQNEGLTNHEYRMFEFPDITDVEKLFRIEGLSGLNVTLPYKTEIIPYLDALDPQAERIGAVNVIAFRGGQHIGYNSDYFGFKNSLTAWLGKEPYHVKALILGTGGASKAVKVALEDLNIPFKFVSRTHDKGDMIYEEVTGEVISEFSLIINTSPLGMSPNETTCPPLPYHMMGENHYLYDLVYNPETTLFMRYGGENGAKTMNGLKMLYLQAEASWRIWNE